ncbi:MAG: hypothetical protein OEM26_05090 [Saprospiraceae bacterium]|nr:hypothetical protein [Saprospiraceae bacterium]
MVSITSLWLPILLSAVIVFVVSSIIHMFLNYHRSDYKAVPQEEEVMTSLRAFDIAPGDYIMPCPKDAKDMRSEEYMEKRKQGPVAILTVVPSGIPSMTGQLIQWFIYSVVVSVFAAYIAGRALGPEAHYLEVFRFAGTTAFLGYSLALLQNSIWFSKNWTATLKSVFDGLIYALLTAGTFGWLWP